jgi:uncharacterized protein YndB with AHSA1/START domain
MSDATTAEGISMTRVFDAPRELVFRAWTEPERFAYWFGGTGAEVPMSSVEMDVRAGGAWKATMIIGPDQQIDWHGEFREVEAPERLVLTLSDRPGSEFELVTVELRELGDGRTEMRFRQTGGHMDAEGYEQAKAGWGSFFDAMDENLAAR